MEKCYWVCIVVSLLVFGNVIEGHTNIREEQTDRPVIGILSQPLNVDEFRQKERKNEFYIAASYVKWLESAGARSIAIPYNASRNLLEEVLSQINGVLLPGGEAELFESAWILWDLILKRNKVDYFPVWGTCLGFEFMLMLSSEMGENAVQSGFDAENMTLPLQFTNAQSKLFAHPELRQTFATENITMNNHRNGIGPDAFLADNGLTSLFTITSTNVDRSGRPFVSTMESFHYPFYGTQFHPEKNSFEYGVYPGTNIAYESINHSVNGIRATLALAQFFVQETRQNTKGHYTNVTRFPLIYEFEMRKGIKFEQIFVIPPASHWDDDGYNVAPCYTENTEFERIVNRGDIFQVAIKKDGSALRGSFPAA